MYCNNAQHENYSNIEQYFFKLFKKKPCNIPQECPGNIFLRTFYTILKKIFKSILKSIYILKSIFKKYKKIFTKFNVKISPVFLKKILKLNKKICGIFRMNIFTILHLIKIYKIINQWIQNTTEIFLKYSMGIFKYFFMLLF